MCELFAMSSKLETTVSFSLEEFSQHGGGTAPHGDGWGVAFYNQALAEIYREPKPAVSSEWMDFLKSDIIRSSCVVSHIRRATIGRVALENTQPFFEKREGRTHIFAHNGHLKDIEQQFKLNSRLPIGNTDSEYAFCYLMDSVNSLWERGAPPLADRASLIESVFNDLSALGPANFIYSDGEYLYAFANKRTQTNGLIEPPGMHYLYRHCDCDNEALKQAGLEIECEPQDIVLFASVPLTEEGWKPVESNHLMVAKNGRLLY